MLEAHFTMSDPQTLSTLLSHAMHESCAKRNTVISLDYLAQGTCKLLIALFNPAKYASFSLFLTSSV